MCTNNKMSEKENFIRKCELTSHNYGNFADHLQFRKMVYQIMLPYYSIVGIINGLIPKFFTTIEEYRLNILEFWGIAITITFLLVSMQIALARYPERIEDATKILNKLKILKSKAQNTSENNLEKIWEDYNQIVQNAILVGQRYFYKTCKEIDKRKKYGKDSSEKRKHFSRFEIVYINVINVLEYLLYIFVFALPIIVYLFVFLCV